MSLSIMKSFNEADELWDIKVGGEVDISNADQFRNELNDAYNKTPTDMKIDVADLGYMDSTGLGVIIGIYGKIKEDGHSITLVEPRDNIKKLLRITNLDTVLL